MSGFFESQPGTQMPSRQIAPWDTERVEGPYEGEYLDADYAARLATSGDFKPVMREEYRAEAGKDYSAELGWAINLVETIDAQLATAGSDEERTAIFARNKLWLESNQALIVRARDFIEAKQAEKFVATMQAATEALANGDMTSYREAEQALIQTSPIDTEAIRERVATAYDSTNDR